MCDLENEENVFLDTYIFHKPGSTIVSDNDLLLYKIHQTPAIMHMVTWKIYHHGAGLLAGTISAPKQYLTMNDDPTV